MSVKPHLLVCRKLSYSAQNKCIVVHVPLDATSSVLGRTEWRRDTDKFGKHPPRASAVGPSGPSLCDECWSLARRFGEWDEPTPCGPCAAVFARVHLRCWKDVAHFQCLVVGRPGAFRGVPGSAGVRGGVRSIKEAGACSCQFDGS